MTSVEKLLAEWERVYELSGRERRMRAELRAALEVDRREGREVALYGRQPDEDARDVEARYEDLLRALGATSETFGLIHRGILVPADSPEGENEMRVRLLDLGDDAGYTGRGPSNADG